MHRVVVLLLLVPLLVGAEAARGDGCPPAECGLTGSAVPGSRLLVVRPNGSQGPLVAYDVVTHARRFSLPAGMLSANGRWFFAAKTRRGETQLTRYEARTGNRRDVWAYRGRWSPQAVSANGARVVLFRFVQGSRRTHLGVVAAAGGSLVRQLALPGAYGVENLSPDGRLIFLIHYNRTGGYALQVYDLQTSALRANPARQVDGSREKMTGQAWTAIATRDGRWLLTLYLKPEGGAFVHALDLKGGTPVCVDLPWSGGYTALGMTSLVLSRDEGTLYLANPTLGVVTSVDLGPPHVARTVRFPRWRGVPELGVGPGAAVARDGRTVAFTQNASVWRYDVASGRVVRAPSLAHDVAALAYTPSGRLVALAAGRLVRVR